MTSNDREDDEVKGLLTTGDMARLAGSTLRTIRFYESHGLIKSTERCDGRHRRFEHCELSKLIAVTGLRDAGFSLDEIGELIALKTGPCPQAASARMETQLHRHRERLDERIATLQRLRDEIDGCVGEMSHCKDCDCDNFPTDCGDCDRVGATDSPGLTRLVWKN